MSEAGRVVVVAVHGIADQRPGQTVREVARLLCHGGDGAPRYVRGETHGVLVPVEKLAPGNAPERARSPEPAPGSKPPDLSRRRPGTPSGFYQVQQRAPATTTEEDKDLGIALNDYLLGRLELPEKDGLYESTRISMRRRAGNQPVDVFELYWADLSRLDSGGIRALSALYQLFFHLGTLAADVVDQIALSTGNGVAWRVLRSLHAWLAWMMKGPAALLQLSLFLLVVFGALVLVPAEQQRPLLSALFGAGALLLGILAAVAWLRCEAGRAWRWC